MYKQLVTGANGQLGSEIRKLAATKQHYSILNKSKIKEKYNIEIPYCKETLKMKADKLHMKEE